MTGLYSTRDARRARRLRGLVLERDRWTCHICQRRISQCAVWPWLTSPTVDHVVPLSAGGASTLDNLAAAHWRCNVLRGVQSVGLARITCLGDLQLKTLLAEEVGLSR